MSAVSGEHPDATYIKQDDLGLVIAKGLAVMYKTQPPNPVDFLAKWLLNYSNIQQTAVAKQEDQKVLVKELKEKQVYQTAQEQKKIEHKEKEVAERDAKIQHFYEKTIGESTDLNDQMQDLADFLKQFTKATAVYIGKLVAPKKKIGEADDDTAHIDAEAQQIIHFLKATESHQYLVDKILKQD
jgi:Dpy-30 motif